MIKQRSIITLTGIITAVMVILSLSTMSFAFAHPHSGEVLINSSHTHEPQTQYIPRDAKMGLEKTTLFFHADKENTLPWGFVEGKIANPVDGYPVIIQFFQDNEAVHFAQTDVNEDGNYEYKFRIQNVNDGKVFKLFEGDYSVVIFKVVYSPQQQQQNNSA